MISTTCTCDSFLTPFTVPHNYRWHRKYLQQWTEGSTPIQGICQRRLGHILTYRHLCRLWRTPATAAPATMLSAFTPSADLYKSNWPCTTPLLERAGGKITTPARAKMATRSCSCWPTLPALDHTAQHLNCSILHAVLGNK